MKAILASAALGAAVVISSMSGANAQQNGKYCLTGSSGGMDCSYETLEQCKAAMKGLTTDSCVVNPNKK